MSIQSLTKVFTMVIIMAMLLPGAAVASVQSAAPPAVNARAAGDYVMEWIASTLSSTDHKVGGAYDDRTIGRDNDNLGLVKLLGATPAAAAAPECSIDAQPTATCSGWKIVFVGLSPDALSWQAKVGTTIVMSGTTKGNETVTGTWPAGIDLSTSQTFTAKIKENGTWYSDSTTFGPCVTPGIGDLSISKTLISGDPAHVGEEIQFGIRITNTGTLTITSLPLQDWYDPTVLKYLGATPASDNTTNDGAIDWANLGPLGPGKNKDVVVRFQALRATTDTGAMAAAGVRGPDWCAAVAGSAPASSPACSITLVPTATCDGWEIKFQGSVASPLNWRAKVDGTIIASGTTKGNETVTGDWPDTVDLSQSHTFQAGIQENGTWYTESKTFGPCARASIGDRVFYDVDGSGLPDGGSEPGINGVTLKLYNGKCADALNGTAKIAVDAVTTGTAANTTKLTLAHTTTSAANRLMLVGVSINRETGSTNDRVTSMTYGGQALTLLGAVVSNGTTEARVEIWALTNPPSGTANVVVTFNRASADGAVVGVVTFTGVKQSSPYGAFVSNKGNGTGISVVVGSAADELVFDTATLRSQAISTVGVGQTQKWRTFFNNRVGAGGSIEPGAAPSVTMSWTGAAAADWAIGAVSLKPATGVVATPMTTTVTAGKGNYRFNNLPAGDYCVEVDETTLPAGVSLTTDNEPLTVSLTDGQSYGAADFGYREPCPTGTSNLARVEGALASTGAVIAPRQSLACVDIVCEQEIRGRLWRDEDRDALMDPDEVGLASIKVALLGDGGNPARPVVMETITDADGYYSFKGMAPGPYYVDANQGWIALYLHLFRTTQPGSSPVPVETCATEVVDVGYGPLTPGTGALGNYLWYDANRNSIQDEFYDTNGNGLVDKTLDEWDDTNGNDKVDEAEIEKCPLRFVEVKLYSGSGALLQMTLSDHFGFYDFFNLPAPAYYRVNVNTQEPAWLASAAGYQADGLCKTIPADLLGYITTGSIQPTASAAREIGGSGNEAMERMLQPATRNPELNLSLAAPAAVDATAAADISGQVRVDRDVDGDLTEADAGLAGVSIGLWRDVNGSGLKDVGDTLVMTTTTDVDGKYLFSSQAAPNQYVILEVDPVVDMSGDPAYRYASTGDSDPPNDNQIAVTLAEGVNATGNDFLDVLVTCRLTNPFGDLIWLLPGEINLGIDFSGYCTVNLPGAIGDFVWYDSNGNGVQNVGEPGLANVHLTLYMETDGSAGLTVGDTVIMTQTTDADGGYLFKDLPAGTYFVDVTDAANPNGTLNGLTHMTGLQSQPDPFGPIVLTIDGQIYKEADFGYVKQPDGKALVGDTVWYDDNGDRIQQPGEPGIPGVTVIIRDSSSNQIGSAVTDSNGHYRVEVQVGSGYTAAPAPNTVPANLSATTPASVGLPPLAAGQQYLDADFGYDDAGQNLLGEVGNLVWLDADKDGVFDSGELPLPGVSVDLIRDTNADGVWQQSEPIIATVTSGNTLDGQTGNYLFTGVPQGHYLVHVSDTNAILTDFSKSPVASGADHVNRTDPYPVYLVTAGANNYTADFAYFKPDVPGSGLIGNQVWIETESLPISPLDGLFDPLPGDFGQPGVTIALYRGGVYVTTTTTGASGDYSFVHLPTGAYTVTVSDQQNVLAGYAPTTYPADQTGDNTNKNQPYAVTLPAGGYNLTADFGYAQLSGQSTAAYQIIKRLNTPAPVRINREVSFTLWITNTSDTAWITYLPLRDVYSTTYLSYLRAVPASLDNVDDGEINWQNLVATLGPMPPNGGTVQVVVWFKTLRDTSGLPESKTPNTVTAYNAWADADGPSGPLASVIALPDKSSTAPVGVYIPTGVGVSGFSAAPAPGGIALAWETASEQNIAGFNVLRKADASEFVVVNSELLFAQNAGSNQGAAYSFTDTQPGAGRLTYTLQVVRLDGSVETVGQVEVAR